MTEQFCQLLWIRNFSLIFSWPNAIHIALSHAGRCPGQRWVMLTFVQDSAESSWVLSRTQLSQAEFGQDTAELWTGQRWVKLSFVKDSAKLSWVLSGTALSQAESTRRCGLPKSQFQKRVRVIRLLLLFNSKEYLSGPLDGLKRWEGVHLTTQSGQKERKLQVI